MVVTKDEDSNTEPRRQGSATKGRKKQKRDPSYKEDTETFEYVLESHEKKRDNVTYIQGYTGHLKDPVYIKLMHGRLNFKLKQFVINMNHIMNKLAQCYEDDEEPPFIAQVKRLVIKPLHDIQKKIAKFNDLLIHVLAIESISRELHIHDNEDVVNIIQKMCLTETFDARLSYNNETGHVEFELNFDNKEYLFKNLITNAGII